MKMILTKLTFTSMLILGVTSLHAQDPAQAQMIKDMDLVMEKVQAQFKANPNMSKEEQKALVMQMMGQTQSNQNILEKQKAQLPKILKILTTNKTCLSKADTKAEANACEKEAEALAKKIDLEDAFEAEEQSLQHQVWDKKTKKRTLAEIDEEITHIQHSLPCIQNAKTMSDMMKCSQEK